VAAIAATAVVVAVPVAAQYWQQLLAASSPRKRQQRRDLAWMRMAERFASDSSQGYPDHYGRYLEHCLGGRPWTEGWGADGWEEAHTPELARDCSEAPLLLGILLLLGSLRHVGREPLDEAFARRPLSYRAACGGHRLRDKPSRRIAAVVSSLT
jgi:hypothetical protein